MSTETDEKGKKGDFPLNNEQQQGNTKVKG